MLRGLAGGVDDLGDALAGGAAEVEGGDIELADLALAQASERLPRGESAAGDGVEGLFELVQGILAFVVSIGTRCWWADSTSCLRKKLAGGSAQVTVLELVISLAAILGAAILFTNAIEILGERLHLGQGAVGSVLAAVGTALPETMIPVVALIGAAIAGEGAGGSAGEIGIGAILGAPFLLATLAMFVVGAAALGYRGRRKNGAEIVIERATARRDIGFFLTFFAIAAAAGIVQLPVFVKILIAVVLLVAYGLHVLQTIRAGGESLSDTPDKLTLWPGGSPAPNWAVYAQVFGSLAVMAYGAHLFVGGVEHLSGSLGIPAALIALVLAPLATELPEKFNSVIWLRDDKDTLAFGNITGAMVFQSTVPVAIGLLFTSWELDFLTAFATILALASGTVLLTLLLRKTPLTAKVMMGAGSLYAVFVVVAIYQVVTG